MQSIISFCVSVLTRHKAVHQGLHKIDSMQDKGLFFICWLVYYAKYSATTTHFVFF